MQSRIYTAVAALAATLALAMPALAAETKTVTTAKGPVLAAANGKTLYTFRNDKDGQSNCYDKCAANWPPFVAAADAKPANGLTLVTRKDGAKQWAKGGMPLYFWVKDQKEGDTTGDGVNGVWDVAKP